MDILMVASEAVPYLRTSDVANVVTGLSTELRRKHNVRVVLPHYRSLEIEPTTPLRHITEFPVHLGAYTRQAHVQCLYYETPFNRLPVYLIGNEFYFGRDNPYGYLDDYERFIFFTRAIIEMLRDPEFCKEEEGWKPEVIHGHDWIAGLLPMCLQHMYKGQSGLESITFVYTIHNASFPGQFGYRAIKVAELDELGVYRSIGETPNRINFMARGILVADAINTVSPRHAEEISSEGYSNELMQALRVSQKTITGILNGFDYSSYKRTFDKSIKHPFDQDSLENRRENKQALQEECGLTVGSDIPLLGWISRLIPDKGIRLLEEIIPKLVQEEIQIVIAGIVGDDYRSREVLSRFQREHPRHVAPIFTSGDSLFSRKIVAGADIILVPSIREPCGQQQMAALRYGAIPVVRNTGGLADTVIPWNSSTGAHTTGKGFLFNEPTPESLLQAIRDAVRLYRSDPGTWQDLQVYNMGVRFSWSDSAKRYVKIYEKAKEASKTRLSLEKGEEPKLDQSDLLLNAILEISELGATIVDQEQYLVQVARKIRELMRSDAVLIWLPDETDPQKLIPIGHSFKRHGNASQLEFDPRAYRVFSEQDSRSWQYIFHLKSEGEALPPASPGFLSSELAQKRSWANQLSVPANAHGVFLGKIDVFSCEAKHTFSEDIHILQAFASAVAVSLEKSRASRETQALLTADREMAKAQTVAEIVEVVLRHAKNFTRAEAGRLDLSVGRSYTLDSNDQFRMLPPSKPMELQPGSPIPEGGVTSNIDLSDGVEEASGVPMPLRTEHGSQILTAITNEKGEVIGTITVSKAQPVAFLRDEVGVLRSLASQATNVLQAAYSREQVDQSRVGQLRKLAASLVGGIDFDTLLRKVVSTTADVLQAEAASLYLINENNQLVIQAAHGYHVLLLAAGSAKPYDIGEGITGWLAERGETFKADSLEELHAVPQWKGKHKGLQNEREPSVFLGIPLKVTERANQQERVIGVLKLEDRIPQRPFTDQDMRLSEMMANVIATVIQNTRLSETSLRDLNANLRKLSTVMVGGLEMRVLVQRIVNTIAEVVGADASSLYLIEPGTQMLTIQAATGYQSGLVEKKARYDLRQNKGITAWIARTGQPFKASSTGELRSHPEWAGKHNPDQGGREPNAFLGIPLKVITAGEREEIIGVLKVEDIRPGPRHPESHFTEQDEVLVEMMGNVITTVIQNTRLNDIRLRELNTNLQALSTAMVGGLEMHPLVRRIVDTIAEVLGADASSLYLIEPGTQMLTIQAATGYQSGLVEKEARYDLRQDKGITAEIVRTGQPFKASSTDELRSHPEWAGKHNSEQGNREPNAFLGIPLKVITAGEREEIIGVLKVEDIRPGPRHPESHFTEQDEVLVEMMGNVITTVIQNTRLNDIRLRELNTNLQALSTAMVGGLEMHSLVRRIVDTIAKVLGADASSLYLIEPGTQMLTIQAATGYQSGLVAKGAEYDLRRDKGITAWIARTGHVFKAKRVDELRRHPEWAGKHNSEQGNREPSAFLGIPLKVIAASGSEEIIGVLKVEDIRPGPRHPEAYFTEQDEVLVEMMGNVITTVIQNTRLSNKNLDELLSDMFVSLVPFREEPYKALHPFISHRNEVVLNAITQKLLSILPDGDRVSMEDQTNALREQTIELLNLDANPELFRTLAKRSKDEAIRSWYDTLYYLYSNPTTDLKKITEALSLGQTWLAATDTKRVTQEKLRHSVRILATTLAQAAGGEAILVDEVGQWVAFEMPTVLTESSIGISEALYMLFFMGSEWRSQEEMKNFRSILPRLEKEGFSIISVVSSLQKEDWKESTADLRRELEIHGIDFISFTLTDILSIVSAKQPQDLLLNRLLQEINLLTVSPYKTTGPIFDKMFFGREKEIREITDQIQSTNYAIIGGRRVGKSSFLIRLHVTSLPKRGFRSVYYNCTNTPTYEDFLAAHPRNWQPAPEPQQSLPWTFDELLRLPPEDMPLVLLLDEADKLIPADRAARWPLFNALRASASFSQVHVILSGERTLRSALRDDSSPLFNFVNEKTLGPLDYPAVEKLVTRPMQQMGITLIDEDAIVERIWDFTSGHPNVVQRLCHKLIIRLNEKRSRLIRLDDVEGVINDPEFQEVDFLKTYLAQSTPLEQIIALLMALNKNDKPYRLQSIIELLGAQGLHPDGDIAGHALDRLTDLRSILRRSQAGYEFAVKAFPRILENRVTAEDMLIKLKSEYMRDLADVKEVSEAES